MLPDHIFIIDDIFLENSTPSAFNTFLLTNPLLAFSCTYNWLGDIKSEVKLTESNFFFKSTFLHDLSAYQILLCNFCYLLLTVLIHLVGVCKWSRAENALRVVLTFAKTSSIVSLIEHSLCDDFGQMIAYKYK